MSKIAHPPLDTSTREAACAATDTPVIDREALSERFVQFGEGNFLRAFMDWMIDLGNAAGQELGRVAVVQPLPRGMGETLNAQDGLYTVLLRGVQNGEAVDTARVVQSVSRCIDPYADWQALMALARQSELRFAISNTTEAGIAYVAEDQPQDSCPESFPAKLCAFLYERFRAFDGAADKGLILLPCELIERNGDKLKDCLRRHAEAWDLPQTFRDWLDAACPHCNTLVDRIVPGYPADEADALAARLGYRDALIAAAEPFLFMAIEGDTRLAAELPLHELGLDVVWTDDMTPYRTRKVRILNGAHTVSVLAGFLAGCDTVGEMVGDPTCGAFLQQALQAEILPHLEVPEEDKRSFAAAVLERFANPHVCHRLLTISLNSVSKYRVRVMPSLKAYHVATHQIPPALSFGLAALLAFYRGTGIEDGALLGDRGGTTYQIKDDPAVLAAFATAWSGFANDGNLHKLVYRLLADRGVWNEDLTAWDGLVETVCTHLSAIMARGCRGALDDLLARSSVTA